MTDICRSVTNEYYNTVHDLITFLLRDRISHFSLLNHPSLFQNDILFKFPSNSFVKKC